MPLTLMPLRQHATTLALATVLAASSLVGCASSTIAPDPAAPAETTRPRDAAISLSLSGDQPAWFLVDSDGALRASLGERLAVTPSPPLVRVLTTAEWDALWTTSLAAQAEARALDAGTSEGPARLEVRSHGRVLERNGIPLSPSVQSLAAHLRSLSWADGR